MMEKNAKIYVAGHRGMVGSAIVRELQRQGYTNIITRTHKELDLCCQQQVQKFFQIERPDIVVLAAAKVGGIMANISYPAEFIYQNLEIQNNVINSAHDNGVDKLLFLGSSCIYPRLCSQPMKEEYLLDGKVEPTNEGYAIAKIAGLKMCELFNRQYGTHYFSVMPCNLYGYGDDFDPVKSHVVAATIRKVYEAKLRGDKEIVVWGTGKARRELMFVDDAAEACVYLLNNYNECGFVNVGVGIDYSITELTETVMDVLEYNGKIVYDGTKPDGMPQKLLDVSKLAALGWKYKISLADGVMKTYKWYLENYSLFN